MWLVQGEQSEQLVRLRLEHAGLVDWDLPSIPLRRLQRAVLLGMDCEHQEEGMCPVSEDHPPMGS